MKILIFSFLFLVISCEVNQPNYSTEKKPIDEYAEFTTLMEKDKLDKNQRAAEALNLLLNNDSNTKAAITFNNNTNCNIILRIFGSNDYLLPVPKNGKNFIVLTKGYYNLKYYVCNAANLEHLNITDSKEFTISSKN